MISGLRQVAEPCKKLPRTSLRLDAALAILAIAASLALGVSPAAAVTVEAGSVTGAAGQTVQFAVSLVADSGDTVAGIENDLSFDPSTPVAVTSDGRPDCTPNAAIRKGATAFSFRPLGCDPRAGQCTSVHALVVAVDNVDPIESKAILYRCRVAISERARPGRYPLTVRNALFAPPDGGDHAALASAGAVTAVQATAPPESTPQPTSANAGTSGGSGCQTAAGGSFAPLWLALGLLAWRCGRSVWSTQQ